MIEDGCLPAGDLPADGLSCPLCGRQSLPVESHTVAALVTGPVDVGAETVRQLSYAFFARSESDREG